jgi:thymidylate synthase
MNVNNVYQSLLSRIVDKGYRYLDPNRAKQEVYRKQINKFNFELDMYEFPILTTKEMAWDVIVGETLWFLKGQTNVKHLIENGVNIWNKDAYNYYLRKHKESLGDKPYTLKDFIQFIKDGVYGDIPNYEMGDTGKNYSYQLRNWTNGNGDPVDQLSELVETLKNNPMATKKIVTYWNPAEKHETALTPCHRSWEVMVEPTKPTGVDFLDEKAKEYKLSLSFDMSSVDVFLGLPFNIASYALIANILAEITNMEVGTLYGNLTNVHIYEPHMKQVEVQMSRGTYEHKGGRLEMSSYAKAVLGRENLDLDSKLSALKVEDFRLPNYSSHPALPAKMIAYDE